MFDGATLRAAANLKHLDGWRHAALELRDWANARGIYQPRGVGVEVPRVYPAAKQKGDQNDLIAVAMVAAACASAFVGANVFSYYPRDWKGTIDGDVMTERIKGRLAPHELERVQLAGALSHNIFDGIGIGLHHFNRLQPKRVISRGLQP